MYQSNYGPYSGIAVPNNLRQTVATQPQTFFQPPVLKGRPVASLEEGRATTIDFDGSVFFFPDLANRKIYTKQINMDGTASLNMYELKEIPQEGIINSQTYITREEFETVIQNLRQSMLQGAPKQTVAQPVQTPQNIPAQPVTPTAESPKPQSFNF